MIVAQTLDIALPEKVVATSPKNFNGELWFLISLLGISSFSPSFSSFFGLFWTAMSAWVLNRGVKYDIFIGEYWIDTPWEMRQLVDVVVPDIAIVTRIDSVHSMQMWDATAIAQEKWLLVASAKDVVYLNTDDVLVAWMESRSGVDVLRYGHWEKSLHYAEDIDYHADWSAVQTHAHYVVWKRKYWITTNVYATVEHDYVSLWLSIADILAQRYLIDLYIPNTIAYTQQPGRCAFFAWINKSLLMDSSYNAAPASMRMMIDFAHTIHEKLFPKYSRVLVVGEMRELGSASKEKHEELADYLFDYAPDQLYLIWTEVVYTKRKLEALGYTKPLSIYASSRDAWQALHSYISAHKQPSFVFFKGSQNTIYLEEAVEALLLNPQDVQFLWRQESWWKKRKNAWFASQA